MSRGPYVCLMTGTCWYFTDPRPCDVRWGDVRGISRIARYLGGTVPGPYVVAEHGVRVARLLEAWGCDRDVCAAGLVHDPEHIPPGDLSGPLVRELERQERRRREIEPEYRDLTLHIRRIGERAVWEALGVLAVFEDAARAEPIWRADRVLLATERRDLMAPSDVDWGPLPDPLPERITSPWLAERAWYLFDRSAQRLGVRRP